LLYAQINKDFLILTHIGLNSLNSNTILQEQEKGLKCFLHDVWAQYSGKKQLSEVGLHYWNGISRLNNQSTFDIRQPKASLGYLGYQINCRHIRGLRKGALGKCNIAFL
jgi:hypothetical protein